ncbi:unnamed protein product [Cyclocybe aegerita]|uniref:Uncharacterized protein n=1 Tax=Cyclocybe aegerita TaxID=1973307 RepID=A0A8S0W7A5_CYCAE|nr:unnamed protein product [Cyclocybe aegerita]CAA7261289.1 unnamed protein product [Cyclocybe aegerita]
MSRPSATRSNARRGWWRAYFIDCPLSQADPIFHLFGKSGAKSTKSGKRNAIAKPAMKLKSSSAARQKQNNFVWDLLQQPHWQDRFRRHATINYDEELALYEFLELDADGEEDPELDGVAEEVLAN